MGARTPRAPAGGLRPPAPPAGELSSVISYAAGEEMGARTPRAPAGDIVLLYLLLKGCHPFKRRMKVVLYPVTDKVADDR